MSDSNDLERIRCDLCGEVCFARRSEPGGFDPGYPADAIHLTNTRIFRQGPYNLLHHSCRSRQANTATPYWPDNAWWACEFPERRLDQWAHYDLNCPNCAA